VQILIVVGARPNFMKVAPLIRCLRARACAPVLVHTGQHYDDNMSRVFFEDLALPEPDLHLGVGSGTHSEQTARVMVEFEPVCRERRPDLVVVVGDVNSTLACALVGAKLGVPVAHVEAGLRSYDRRMPEEINRIVTDRLADLLLTPSADADENLLREGTEPSRIHRVGNVMIDSLMENLERARQSGVLDRLSLRPGGFAVLTLHRPSNVDDPPTLLGIMAAVHGIATRLPVVFSCHPRTSGRLRDLTEYSRLVDRGDVRLLPPLGYLEFVGLMSQSRLVLTDSGGLQEETTFLGIPCVTIRENTERPVTVTLGTNVLAGTDPSRIEAAAADALDGRARRGRIPELWDGRTSERIVAVFESWLRDAGVRAGA
jgi:UDP-N-acetylglucosamine 2-epimerase (non-hydrolysing)